MQKLTYVIGKDQRDLVKDIQNFKIDFKKEKFNWLQARQYENEMRQVLVDVQNEDGSPFDLTGANAVFEGVLPDKTHKIYDARHGIILDPVNGQFRFDFPKQAFAVAGSYVQAFFRIMRDGDSVTTLEFDMTVLADKVISGLIPADYITPFEDLYDQLGDIVADAKGDLTAALTEWTTKLSDLFSRLNSQGQDTATLLQTLETKIKADGLMTESEFEPVKDTVDSLNSDWNKYRTTNVVAAGIDNTGSKDVAYDLQSLIDSGTYGVYFPDGVYKISKPIEFPFGTNYPYGIELSSNAHIVATAKMGVMFKLGEKQATPDALPYLNNEHYSELYEIKGGYFHGNLMADTAIQTSQNIKGYKIHEITIDGCLVKNIYLKKTAVSGSHDAVVDNVRINYVTANADASRNAIGILAEASDWTLSNSYISDCGIAVKSLGYFSITDCHFFNGWDGTPSIGVQCPGGLIASNLYVDCYFTGISTLTDDGTFASAFIDLTNFYFYEFTGHSLSSPVHVIDTVDSSTINIANIQHVFSDERATDGSQVIYIRDVESQQTPSSKIDSFSAVGISGIGKAPKVAGDTNAIGDMLYSGTNRNNVSFMVTPGATLTTKTGVIIGWIPYPSGPNANSTQTFRLETDNKYYNATVTLRVYIDSGNLMKNNGGYVKIISDDSNRALHYGVGGVQTINGKKLLPIYIYRIGTGSYYLDRLTVTTIGMSPSGFLFPFTNNADPVGVDSANLLLSDENRAIKVDYDDDNIKYPSGAWLPTDSSTNLFDLTNRGIYQFGGELNWTAGPGELNGLTRYGFIEVQAVAGCIFIKIRTNFDEVYIKNKSGNPATWSSWKKVTSA